MDNMKYEKLEIDGVYYKTTFPEKFTSKKSWTPPEPGHVKTYIPGTVVEIHAREGQHVARGELLCILDAMKMRNRVVAPVEGCITRVLVKTGDKLPKNTLMFEIK